MYDQRNVKKGLFFEAKWDSCESRLGIKMRLFLRKESFYILLGVIFQTPPNISTKIACLGINLGANRNYGMFWKPLVIHVYNKSIWLPPPPTPARNFHITNRKLILQVQYIFTTVGKFWPQKKNIIKIIIKNKIKKLCQK